LIMTTMTRSGFRFPIATVLCGLIAALALGQIGCSLNGESAAEEKRADDRKSSDSDELENPLLQELGRGLDAADDLDRSERDEAWGILREADPVLTRIKEENRKGLEAANRPPKIVWQKQEQPPQGKDEKAPPPEEAKPGAGEAKPQPDAKQQP
jgi:hypothetical protein